MIHVDGKPQTRLTKWFDFQRAGFPHTMDIWKTFQKHLVVPDPPAGMLSYFQEGFLDTKAGKPNPAAKII